MSRNTKQHILRYSQRGTWYKFWLVLLYFLQSVINTKHLSQLEAELISQCLHHIIPFISIHPQNGNNCIVQDSSSNIVSLNDPKTLTHFHVHTPTLSLLRQHVANTHSQATTTQTRTDTDGCRVKHKLTRKCTHTHTVRKSTADVCWTDWLDSITNHATHITISVWLLCVSECVSHLKSITEEIWFPFTLPNRR